MLNNLSDLEEQLEHLEALVERLNKKVKEVEYESRQMQIELTNLKRGA